MVIDIAAHVAPPGLVERFQLALPPMPGLSDLGERMRDVERLEALGYRQVLSIAQPATEATVLFPRHAEVCRAGNEELRELVERHPAHFISALGALPLADPVAALREVDHLVELGLPGFQLYSSTLGRPLDHPASLEVVEHALAHGLVCFLHPARDPVPDYPGETESRYEVFRVFGWPYETTVAMVRLVFAGVFKRHPEAVLVAHHLGGMVPFFASRIATHYERDHPEGENPIQALRLCYGDTALGGGPAAMRCGVDFYGAEHVVYGSDYPFDGQSGRVFVDRSVEAVESAGLGEDERFAILEGNARRILGLKAA